jgi:hypothetical protein
MQQLPRWSRVGVRVAECRYFHQGLRGYRITTLEGLGIPGNSDRAQAVFIAEQAAQMRLLHEWDNYGREGAAQSSFAAKRRQGSGRCLSMVCPAELGMS